MKKNYCKTILLTFMFGLLSIGAWSQTAISTVADLQKIGNDTEYPMSGSYYLTTDIDLTDVAEWIPIGATGVADANPEAFTGVFDGKGFSIKNLTITNDTDLKGLFGTLTNATVQNLTLEVNINGKKQIGAVTGSMQGETLIERVTVKGSIQGLENVGGITGRVQADASYPYYNKIRNCYVNASIKSRTMQAAGVAARANGNLIIEKVFVGGSIEAAQTVATQNAGGLVAFMTNNFVQLLSSVVAADAITGGTPNYFYSNEAKRYPEYFEDIYARNDISLTYFDEAAKGGGAQIVRNDMLLAPERFKEQSLYRDIMLWDFDNVWEMGADGYPMLRTTTAAEVIRTKEKIKVACIGNSITENAAVEYSKKYPSILQSRLGTDKYAVRNYGTGGTCMMKDSDNSFWNLPRLTSAKNWNPDILIIKLGTNDTKDVNWTKIDKFDDDYIDFINQFKTINPDVKVYVCYPLPAYNSTEKDERIQQLNLVIDQIAAQTGATVIDLYTPFIGKESYYAEDMLHPLEAGTNLMATIVYDVLNSDYWVQNPQSISTVEELMKIGNDAAYPLDGQYYLTADIDIPEGTEWIPIGAISATDGNPRHFTGVFDGKGYSIKNLKITSVTNVKGLFGRLGHATVKNLNLVNVDIKGNETVGGVTGAMFGETRIEKVSVSGNIEGLTYVGGITGRVPHNQNYTGYNIIEDCYVTANVTATSLSTNMNTPSVAGGIAGFSVGNTGGYYGKIDIRRVYVSGAIISLQKDNAAGNAAGVLPFYDNHNYIKMDEAIVLADTIGSATPNLFFCRRGPRYNDFELFSNVYARTGITLTYLNNADKGRGGEIAEGIITYLPADEFKTAQFYTTNLSWDFDDVWTINEGEYPVLIDAHMRKDSTLSMLGVEGFTLTPDFSPDVEQYELTVTNTISSVTLNAAPGFKGATVTGGGAKNLIVGENHFTVEVTAKNGTSQKTYTVKVTREEALSDDATLSNLTVSEGTLTPAFSPSVLNYEVTVPFETATITVNAVKNNSGATVEGDGAHSLLVGEQTINVTVTAENNSASKIYVVKVIRETQQLSNDATLTNLTVSEGTLTPAFSPTVLSYTVSVANEISTITLNAVKNHEAATVENDGVKTLNVGDNPFTIKVMAQDGTLQNYVVTVTRQAATGLQNPEAEIKIYSLNHHVYVSSANAVNIEIYSITGQLADRKNNVYDYVAKLDKGLYIIKINGKCTKMQVW